MADPTKRQFVSFAFYKISDDFRKLPASEREAAKKSFVEAAEGFKKDGILLSYSTVGFKAGVDLMLWAISYDLDAIQRLGSAVLKSALGPHLSQPAAYLSMTKRSTYIDKHQHVGGGGGVPHQHLPRPVQVHLHLSLRKDPRMVPAFQGSPPE